jgi:hypothetical protein
MSSRYHWYFCVLSLIAMISRCIEAFKLANQYMFGRPASEPINVEDAPQNTGPQIDLSGIVTRHVPVAAE